MEVDLAFAMMDQAPNAGQAAFDTKFFMPVANPVPDSEDSEYAASNSLMEAREVEMGEKRFAYFVGAERPNP